MNARPERLAAAVIVALAAIVAGCSGTPSTAPASGPAADAPETVTAEIRDLTSVLTVEGAVVATPVHQVRTGAAGRLQQDSRLTQGTPVVAGQVLGSVDGSPVTAAAQGWFHGWLVPDGTTVAPRVPVATVQTGGFAVRAAVPAELAYRVYEGPVHARAQIINGPGPFDCPLLDTSVGDSSSTGAASLAFSCAIPGDLPVFDGLGAILALTTGHASQVLALPIEAVAGVDVRGEVLRRTREGAFETVAVQLGVSDGSYVEIVSGLEAGDTVARVAPHLRPVSGHP